MAQNDIIRLKTEYFGEVIVPLFYFGMMWPPPERLFMDGETLREATDDDPADFVFKRTRMSQLTDTQEAVMAGVARGAEYKYENTIGELQ